MFPDLVPQIPLPGTEYLLATFHNLNQSRSIGAAGVNPISYTELCNYMELTLDQLDLWEIETIRAMDQAYILTLSGTGEQ